jgi:aryl-alcohol dehydrogenase-like predicted oxidoreductase
MNYRKLGTSDLFVSEIGFGCMSLGEMDEANSRLLYEAFDKGINFFDTADLYQKGLNEATVGKALKEKRKELVIATKVGNQWREDGSGWDWNPSKAYIFSAVEKSLRRLQTDYIDLYQLHGGTLEDPIDETIEAFELLKQQGKIRYYGISSIRPNVIREWAKRSNIVSVMMQYSLLDRRPEEACLDLLVETKIGVLARGTLAKGLLIDKPAEAYLNYNAVEVANAAAIIAMLVESDLNKTAIALGYVLNHPGITSAITGIRTIQQLEDIINASAKMNLDKNRFEKLQHAIKMNYYKEHR